MWTKIKTKMTNFFDYATDGSKGSIVDVIKIIIGWLVILWNAFSTFLNSLIPSKKKDEGNGGVVDER